jgi:Mrp family chromosome partitioning ATPase
MGRMLEALKRTEEPNPISEPVLAVAHPGPALEEPAEEEMPFVEVGGPRKSSDKSTEMKLRLEVPSPRPAALLVREPQGVALQSCSQPAPVRSRLASEIIAFHQPDHPVSQQYAALFSQIAGDAGDGVAPVLVLTALVAGAGTTTAVLNLAVVGCGKHAKRICLVDANCDKSAATARLGMATNVGLHEVLAGKIALEKAIHATPIEGLDMLSAGAEAPVGSADAIRWVLAWLQQRYDLILVDGPAWDSADSLRALLPGASAVYLVVDATETDKPQIRAITREAARLGSRLGGLIVAQ